MMAGGACRSPGNKVEIMSLLYSEVPRVLENGMIRRAPRRPVVPPAGPFLVRIAGKVGEIIQGVHERLGAFFVSGAVSTCPDSSWASVEPTGPLALRACGNLTKASQAVACFLELNGIAPEDATGTVVLHRRTPVGKGRGSSSIDASLCIFGVARANGLTAHPATVYRALCAVERSDPVWMAGDLVVARPEEGVLEVIGAQPRFLLLAWDTDPDRTVDTRDAASLDQQRRRHLDEYAALLEMVRTQDPALIQQAATASSWINNLYLPKPGFEQALRFAEEVDAGLLSAHSGTYLALMLSPDVDAATLGRLRRALLDQGHQPEIHLMGGAS
jgi:uncharacterized protein involved in propanediol utilization